MFRSDVVHNKKALLYIFYISFLLSTVATLCHTVRKLDSNLFALPLSVVSYKEKLANITAYDKKGSKLTPKSINDKKVVFYDDYIFKIEIKNLKEDKISIYNKDYLIFSSSVKNKLSLSRTIIPFNLNTYEILFDSLKYFLIWVLKYFVIFLLVVYLLIERINYSTEIRIHCKNKNDDFLSTDKIVFSNSISFKEFIAWICKSLANVVREIIANRFLLSALIIVSILILPILVSIIIRNEAMNPFLFAAYSIHKLAIDPLIYALIIAVIVKIFRFKIFPVIVLSFLTLLTLADAAVYYFGFTVAEKNHISLITPYSVLSFLSWQTILLFTLFVLILIPINIFMIRGVSRIKTSKLFVCVLFLSVINLPSFVYPVLSLFYKDDNNKISIREINDNLSYATQNTIINIIEELIFVPLSNKPNKIDINKFKDVVEYYEIPFGKRTGGLDVPPPEKIVIFTSESLSLDILSTHNKKITPPNSWFYEIDEIKNKTKTNYYTTSHNTLQGMITSINSHPNYLLLAEGKKYYFQNSYIKKLRENGYKTIFLRSASKYFASEDKIFSELGFDTIIGREDFEKENPEYVNGWGVTDRIMYNKLVNLLNEYKDEKLFIMILGTDTHPLDGRKHYFGLDYPCTSKDWNKYKESEYFLNSVAHHSYDMYNLYHKLKNDGLYDEKTCFIYTADHSCPLNPANAGVPDYPLTSIARIPLIIDYKWISENDYKKNLSSQVDLAPTILDIAGIEPPDSYWGNSLFSKQKTSSVIQYDQERIYIHGRNKRFVIHCGNGENYYEKMLIKYFNYVGNTSDND